MSPAHRFSAVLLLLLVLGIAFGADRSRAGYSTHSNLTYADESPDRPSLNQLDVYTPDGESSRLRPVVIWVHGGGWMRGDKTNRLTDKINLFTGAGYVFVSVNYRLSPDIGSGTPEFAPDRVRFPVHPRDVGQAVSWTADHASEYGGDPDSLMLIGHSAGAHLVSLVGTDPSYLKRHDTSSRQISGVVSLDAGALDVARSATQTRPRPTYNNQMLWNAFGLPSEEAVSPQWHRASPITFADRGDPRHLLVTQAAAPVRIAENSRMATALGQDPAGILRVPLDHAGINHALGDPSDSTTETRSVMEFIAGRLAARPPARVSIRKRPAKVVKVGRKRNGKPKVRKIRFAFTGSGITEGFQCRIGGKPFRPCTSPRKYRVRRGSHSFRVRPLYPSGRPGPVKTVKFKVKAKPRKKHAKR